LKNKFLFFCIVILFLVKSSHVLAQPLDYTLLKSINQSYTESGSKPLKIITESVTPISISAPLSMLIVSYLKHDKTLQTKALSVSAAFLLNGISTSALKLSIKRDRPYVSYPGEIVKHTSSGSYSFPSGHTSSAFATATSLSIEFPKWYVIAPSYLWAGAMGYSRMYLGVHYPSDVFIGALIGSGSSIASHYLIKALQRDRKRKSVENDL